MEHRCASQEAKRKGRAAIMLYLPAAQKEKLNLAAKLTDRSMTELLGAVALKIHLILPLLEDTAQEG